MVRKKRIVVLGAGFAGMHVIQGLMKEPELKTHELVLVDRNAFHLYTPDLYEVATAFNLSQDQCPRDEVQLRETIATPLSSLIDLKRVRFIQDEVIGVSASSRKIKLKTQGDLDYTVLVVALGSVPHFFNIPGLEQYALPLKTLRDGLSIHSTLKKLFCSGEMKSRKNLTFAIGGGGPTGIEMAAELAGALDHFSAVYGVPRKKLKTYLIEASDQLASLGKKGTTRIKNHFDVLGVGLYLNHRILKLKKKSVMVQPEKGKSKELPFDFFVWTGGVQVNPMVTQSLGSPTLRGAIEVNPFLQMKTNESIFAAGDNAFILDPSSNKPLPMLAQLAYTQGDLVAKNIIRFIRKQPLKPYRPSSPVWVIPIGGRVALLKVGSLVISGFFCWMLRRFISFRYLSTVLPFFRAVSMWWKGNRIFMKND